jgi:hypothetical protein
MVRAPFRAYAVPTKPERKEDGMTRESTVTISTTERTQGACMHHPWRRVVVALVMISAGIASPVLARGVSAAPGPAGPSQTLVYQSSWQTGTLDWSAHSMKWSVSHGILMLLPERSTSDHTGWLVAPYRTNRRESFAIQAVIRVTQEMLPGEGPWGWTGWVGLIAHAGARSWVDNAGVNGACLTGNADRAGIVESADLARGWPGVSTPLQVSMRQWNTYRLEVRYNSASGQDAYTYKINRVAVVSSMLGDWMQNNRIALNTNMRLEVKSLKVYRLH